MGETGLRYLPKRMIKSDLANVSRSKSIASFQSQFDLGIETLDKAAGIVDQESAVGGQGSGDLLERIQAAFSDFPAPSVEEFAGPRGRRVCPEVLECFDQEEGPRN